MYSTHVYIPPPPPTPCTNVRSTIASTSTWAKHEVLRGTRYEVHTSTMLTLTLQYKDQATNLYSDFLECQKIDLLRSYEC